MATQEDPLSSPANSGKRSPCPIQRCKRFTNFLSSFKFNFENDLKLSAGIDAEFIPSNQRIRFESSQRTVFKSECCEAIS